jgi:hypothetical protein
MSFTNDPTTLIGKVRMYSGEADEDSYVLTDEQITICISDAGGEYLLAAYLTVRAKIAYLTAQPSSQSYSTYSQSYSLAELTKLCDKLKADAEEAGLSTDGHSVAQFGRAEVARDRRTHAIVERNKALRGESY